MHSRFGIPPFIALLEHLQSKFPAPHLPSMVKHFDDEFGVKVRYSERGGGIYLFKYGMIDAKWHESPVPYACRGSILQFRDGLWHYVSLPFDKFFNMHEHYCPVTSQDVVNSPSDYSLSAKEDGSCIQVYHIGGEWHASTLGTIETSRVGDWPETFEDLFWELFGDKTKLDHVPKDLTLIFELCTTKNRIVTRYPKDKIVLLGARARGAGFTVVPAWLKRLSIQLDVIMPNCIQLYDHTPLTQDTIANIIEDTGIHDEIFGMGTEFPEGYVLNYNGTPVAKFKKSIYLALHHTISGDEQCTRKNLVKAVFDGSYDDIQAALDPNHLTMCRAVFERIEELRIEYHMALGKILNDMVSIDNIDERNFNKKFAISVQKHVQKEFQAFFFSNRVKLLNINLAQPDFVAWLKENSDRQLDMWVKVMKEAKSKSP